MTLKSQPTPMPTRKVVAMAIATFLVGGALAVADFFLPGLSDALPADQWIVGAAGVIAAYMTRDRA